MSAEFTHSPTPEEIMEYLDGEGQAASRDAIAAHLATCGTCQAVATDLRAVSAHAQAWTVTSAPASLQAPAPAGAKLLRFRGWPPSRAAMAALAAAAALLIIIIVPFSARYTRLAVGRPSVSAAKVQMGERAANDAIGSGVVGGRVQGQAELRMPAAAAISGMSSSFGGQADRTGPRTPAVIRTARLQIVAKDFTRVRSDVESLVSAAAGFIDHMTVTGDTSSARVLRGTLRVPADRMAAVLGQLRAMGQVVEDTQGSQDVTDQIVDLDARIASGRATELRLVQLIRDRTGKLSDVLEVERELTRVRLDIERLMAEKTNLDRRVSYTTIDVIITEERKATIDGPLSLMTRIRIAAADGIETAFETVAAMVLFILRAGPTLVLLGLFLGMAWLFGRRMLKPASR
jgi:hypothetical protein